MARIRVTAQDLDRPDLPPKVKELEGPDVVWVVAEPMYLHNFVKHGNGTVVVIFKVGEAGQQAGSDEKEGELSRA